MIGSHISIYGEIQGSGYRAWAKDQCAKLDLLGWARKASDGSIEIFAQGEEENVNTVSYTHLTLPTIYSV